MTIFTMGKITAVCEFESTRSGFRHIAVLLINGCERERTKCCYLNRTWECFMYQAVLQKLIEKTDALTKRQKTAFAKKHFRE